MLTVQLLVSLLEGLGVSFDLLLRLAVHLRRYALDVAPAVLLTGADERVEIPSGPRRESLRPDKGQQS